MLETIASKVIQEIRARKGEKAPFLAAIDGRSAAGKSSLAAMLSKALDCPVISMDHFFLRPEQRVPSRYLMPGGNVDHERFLEEVLLPLRAGKSFSYRPFDCQTMDFAAPVQVPACPPIVIVEGSYACHPLLWKYYDLHIFLNVDSETQKARILDRNGQEQAEEFFSRWIPLEERYFDAFQIASHCELNFES